MTCPGVRWVAYPAGADALVVLSAVRREDARSHVLDHAGVRGLLHVRRSERRYLRLVAAVLRRRAAGPPPRCHRPHQRQEADSRSLTHLPGELIE